MKYEAKQGKCDIWTNVSVNTLTQTHSSNGLLN